MSYDLHLFQPVPGEDPKVTARRLFTDDEEWELVEVEGPQDLGEPERLRPEEEIDEPAELAKPERPPRVIPPGDWANWRRRMADALLLKDPRLTVCEPDYSQLAGNKGVSEDQARQDGWLEMHGPEDLGVTISLFSGDGGVSIAYWHEGDEAAKVMNVVLGYLEVLEREGGLRAYDPQMERVVDLARDRRSVVRSHGQSSGMIASFFGRRPEKRPWWRFW